VESAGARNKTGVSGRASTFAPFEVPSFRFQWPADLATSFAVEMENLILGWYVLAETHSVTMLTIFASLQYLGTLIAPLFGVAGDRVGHRNLLASMRGVYAACAVTLTILAFTGLLSPLWVMGVASVMGLVRPSDIGMRAALVSETMPSDRMLGAMGIQRTTQDMSKVFGALTGAGLVAWLGIGPAYTIVTALYVTSVLLTLKAGGTHASHAGTVAHSRAQTSASAWHELKEGIAYVWRTPHLLAGMWLAFLLNLTAFPLTNGLQPYVAKEVFGGDQTTLGYMVAGTAIGALLSSITLSRFGHSIPAARAMMCGAAAWYLALIVYAHIPDALTGNVMLFFVGWMQSVSQVPLASTLLTTTEPRLRGRVMGIRMLAIYGNVPGLLLAGPMIARFGYSITATLYCLFGLAFIALITFRWRAYLWDLDAPSNKR
jgi:MFS family permease